MKHRQGTRQGKTLCDYVPSPLWRLRLSSPNTDRNGELRNVKLLISQAVGTC